MTPGNSHTEKYYLKSFDVCSRAKVSINEMEGCEALKSASGMGKELF